MYNQKFITLICLLLLSRTFYGLTMKKNDVLNIDILQYKSDRDCPAYSSGYDYTNGHCKFRFFCKGDYCSTKDNNGFVQLPNNNGTLENLNSNICITGNNKNPFCFNNQPSCKSNADCLTNNCSNNTCVANKDAPVIECVDYYYYRSLTFSYEAKMYCGLGEYEQCKDHNDCASRACGDSQHGDTCVNALFDRSRDKSNDILAKILIAVSLILAIICSCCFAKKASKKAKEQKELNAYKKRQELNNRV